MNGYVIRIPNWHPTPLNKLIHCKHWSVAQRFKRADEQMIGVYAHISSIPKATGKRSVQITIILDKGQRSCDPDAYFKSTHDALKNLGYLKGDSEKWLVLKAPIFERGIKATILTLEDLQ